MLLRAAAYLNLSLDAKQIAENFFTILNEAFEDFNAADIHGDDAVLDFKSDKLASYFHCLAAVIAYVAYAWAYKPLCGASASSYRSSLIGL